MEKLIRSYKEMLTDSIEKLDEGTVIELITLLRKSRDDNKKIIIMGNGGSGATASHFAGDLNKGLSLGKPLNKRYRVISLTDNTPTVLSLANDLSYDDIFVEQMKNFLREGDLVIALSGSGNSENVLRAVRYAKESHATVVGLTGYSGGKLKEMSDISIHIDVDNMQVTEDLHMILLHMLFYVMFNAEAD